MCSARSSALLVHFAVSVWQSHVAGEGVLSLQAICCFLANHASLQHKTEGSKEWLTTQGQLQPSCSAEPLVSA